MSTGNENLRKINGGVVGGFTPISTVVTGALDVGSNASGIKIPAGKLVVGGYIKNLKNDLAGVSGATVGLKVGTDEIISATTIANLKGKQVATIDTSPTSVLTEKDLYVAIATANITACTLEIGAFYI